MAREAHKTPVQRAATSHLEDDNFFRGREIVAATLPRAKKYRLISMLMRDFRGWTWRRECSNQRSSA
jgi:hypothetical protein